ncbi:hypothetical protein MANY_31670 [Mycolicibacterium anyangense]|jgi:antitoxin (DNA-binding transcriptional repressor) of toxin-antitoxin stability system|uniref:Antitoxin n=1 Tax=Mycolicibacterium anyangense TaxID=1431246 RepID=A0A6N4W772_9MYCO|nr:hypothetical protein [Mycolicibacterium anyangense]BBZ77830.1 hypothetical protein MANY_31670 [Mycolicibacterium anyangense]
MIETIGVGQLRADTCRYLQRVAGGDTLQVIRRGRVALRIEPVSHQQVTSQRQQEMSGTQVIAVQLSHLRSQASRYLDQAGSGCTMHVYHRGQRLAQIRSAGH